MAHRPKVRYAQFLALLPVLSCESQRSGLATARELGETADALEVSSECAAGLNVIVGTDGPDSLYGTPADDCIIGLAGDDQIEDGQGGNDVILGGSGNDTIASLAGGEDLVRGGPGDDTIYSGDGDHVIEGETGDDQIFDFNGSSVILGGPGADTIYAGDADDTIHGNDGNDVIFGEGGTDLIEGGDGKDGIVGGSGNDSIRGNGGDDAIAGDDGDDTLWGDDGDDQLFDGHGNDTVSGGNGNDSIEDGQGEDVITGDSGNDVIESGTAVGTGNILVGGNGNDVIRAQEGNDIIAGQNGNDVLSGRFGNDVIIAGSGRDLLNGGPEADACSTSGLDCEAIAQPSSCSVSEQCAPGERCLSVVGICVKCLADNECDDGDPCTDDRCLPTIGCASSLRAWSAPTIALSRLAGALPALDATGNVIAATQRMEGSAYSVWSTRYQPTTGWSPEVRISDPLVNAYLVQMTANANGDALAVWHQSEGSVGQVWSSLYTSPSGWTAPEMLSLPEESSAAPQVAVDAAGNALAVWSASATPHQDPWHTRWRRFLVGTGWSPPALLSGANGGNLAMNAAGDAILLSARYTEVGSQIMAFHYTPGGNWSPAQPISPGNGWSGNAAIDPNGNAIAVWYQSNYLEGTGDVWWTRYLVGQGWAEPAPLGSSGAAFTDAGSSETPKIGMDAYGNALVLWKEQRSTETEFMQQIWASRYIVDVGWLPAELLSEPTGVADAPALAVDASGNANAAWSYAFGARGEGWTKRYEVNAGWKSAERVSSRFAYSSTPSMAMNESGDVIAMWGELQVDAAGQIVPGTDNTMFSWFGGCGLPQ